MLSQERYISLLLLSFFVLMFVFVLFAKQMYTKYEINQKHVELVLPELD